MTTAIRLARWFISGGWKKVLIGALLLGLIGDTAWIVRDHYTAKAAQAELKTAQDDNVLLVHAGTAADRAVTGNLAAKASINHKEAQGYARTQRALDAHPDWAQQPIPADVIDSLRD